MYIYTYIYTHNRLLLSHPKEWNNTIYSTMDRPRVNHIKWSKSERERQISHDITYVCNLKNWYKWTYLPNRNKFTDIESKFMVTKEDGVGGDQER